MKVDVHMIGCSEITLTAENEEESEVLNNMRNEYWGHYIDTVRMKDDMKTVKFVMLRGVTRGGGIPSDWNTVVPDET